MVRLSNWNDHDDSLVTQFTKAANPTCQTAVLDDDNRPLRRRDSVETHRLVGASLAGAAGADVNGV
jgi:hypothetical protein